MTTGTKTTSLVIAVGLGVAIGIAVILTLLLGSMWKASIITLPDGRHVTCVRTLDGGISCDWQGIQ